MCEVDAEGATNAEDVIDRARDALRTAAIAADGRPVAARVVVSGASGAHAEIAAAPDRWVNEVRAAANDVEGEGVWVEKVIFRTRAPIDLAELRDRDDAIGQLARSIDELRKDEASTRALFDELDELKKKLPIELTEGEALPIPSDAAAMRDVLDDVEQILLPRLLFAKTAPVPAAPRIVSRGEPEA
jgi:hypothetical protein